MYHYCTETGNTDYSRLNNSLIGQIVRPCTDGWSFYAQYYDYCTSRCVCGFALKIVPGCYHLYLRSPSLGHASVHNFRGAIKRQSVSVP
jgi:hypothetical protein